MTGTPTTPFELQCRIVENRNAQIGRLIDSANEAMKQSLAYRDNTMDFCRVAQEAFTAVRDLASSAAPLEVSAGEQAHRAEAAEQKLATFTAAMMQAGALEQRFRHVVRQGLADLEAMATALSPVSREAQVAAMLERIRSLSREVSGQPAEPEIEGARVGGSRP